MLPVLDDQTSHVQMTGYFDICINMAGADAGFPVGGGANLREGAPTYDFGKFSEKLHEIEKIWAVGGRPPWTRHCMGPVNFLFTQAITLLVLRSASALSSIDHNGKNWIIERKWNQKLLSPSTIKVSMVCCLPMWDILDLPLIVLGESSFWLRFRFISHRSQR